MMDSTPTMPAYWRHAPAIRTACRDNPQAVLASTQPHNFEILTNCGFCAQISLYLLTRLKLRFWQGRDKKWMFCRHVQNASGATELQLNFNRNGNFVEVQLKFLLYSDIMTAYPLQSRNRL